MLNCIYHTKLHGGVHMRKTGRAFFVDFPRVLSDLYVPHDINTEQDFEICATVKLNRINYENFITDMVADRQFIEDYCDLCSLGRVWRCLLVQQDGRKDGVLVIPVDCRYVKYAAFYRGE